MKKSYKDFLEQVSKDEALKERLMSIDVTDETAMKQDVLEFAKELGYDLSMEDLEFPNAEMQREISDQEMHAVSGGGKGEEDRVGCACTMAGGGGGYDYHDGKKYGCACVGYGQGGDGGLHDRNCECILGGVGNDNEINMCGLI